jgi:Sigma-70 region 2
VVDQVQVWSQIVVGGVNYAWGPEIEVVPSCWARLGQTRPRSSSSDRYEASVVGYFARRVGDREVVADLTAEVFAAAVHAAARYRPTQPTAAGWC